VQLNEAPLPKSFGDVLAMHYRIMAAEAAAIHRDAFTRQPEMFKPRISQLIRDGLATSAADLSAARAHQTRFAADVESLISDVDALVMPATVTTAPDCETTGDPKFNSPWSYAGVPAVTFCCDLAEDGMPVGLQLVARRNGDESLLAIAAWCYRLFETPIGL
jgi:aspartyl-tRNA(Asn)/glutamyl-tRNA(Gln) amidotransferase subunit A